MKRSPSQPDAWNFVHRGFAAEWFDGLPLGNGDLGALMLTDHKQTRFPLAKSDLWDERCDDGSGRRASCYPFRNFKVLRRLLEEEKWDEIDAAFARAQKRWKGSFALLPAGALVLDTSRFEKEIEVLSVKRHLDMRSGVASSVLHTRVRAFEMRALVSTRYEVLAIRVRNRMDWRKGSPPRRMTFGLDISLDIKPSDPEAKVSQFARGRTLSARVRGYHEIDYSIVVGVSGSGVKVGGADGRLTATSSAAADFTLYLAVASGPKGPTEAQARIKRAAKAGFAKVSSEHVRSWKKFWKASEVSVPDERILRQYHFGLYQLASSSRRGFRMPGLQGLWYTRAPGTKWNEYTNDLNIQMCYWPAYASNHLEIAWPYYETIRNWLPETRDYTRKYWGAAGIQFSCCSSPTGLVPLAYIPVMHCAGNSAFVVQNFWTHYLYSRDDDFLSSVAYPVLKESALFYLDFLEKDPGGRYNIWPSCSPEAGEGSYEAWGKNSAMDVALVKMLLRAVIYSSHHLGRDADLRAACEERLAHLCDYPMKEGAIIDMESKEFLYSHRHNGMITPIYPCADPDVPRSVAKATIDRFNARGKWLWGCHTVPWQAAAEARVGRGREAAGLLQEFVDTWTAPQGGFNLNYEYHRTGRGIPGPAVLCNESVSGFSAALLEMLIQSHAGVIEVFPAVPPEWRDVSFSNLRTEGACLVSAWRHAGRTASVEVHSEIGGEFGLRSPWTGRIVKVRLQKGETIRMGASGVIR